MEQALNTLCKLSDDNGNDNRNDYGDRDEDDDKIPEMPKRLPPIIVNQPDRNQVIPVARFQITMKMVTNEDTKNY
jgi:hypothetical protein